MKVLLVDDAAFVRMSLKKILDDMALGFEYIEAGDGEDAIEKYKIYSPDLVIMDITMPKITAVGRIKEIDDNAKIIMCSSMGYQEKVLDAITAGAKDFIIKPYEAAKVAKSIKAVLKLGEE